MSLRRLVFAVLALAPVPVLAVAGQPAAAASQVSPGPLRTLPERPVVSFTLRRPALLRAGGDAVRLPAGRVALVRKGSRRMLQVDGRRRGSVSTGTQPWLQRGVAHDVFATSRAPVLLLVHRLAALRQAAPRGGVVQGTDRWDRLRVARGWMLGFWPGALWHAYDLTGRPPLLRGWAQRATRAVLGHEDADMHDVGMVASRSSIAAWRRLCDPGGDSAWCRRLRASILRSAGTLRALIATNTAAGTLPTRSTGVCAACPGWEADTIVDSVMNIEPLWWEASHGGSLAGPGAARRHLDRVAELLLQADGSTTQSVHFDRTTGAVVKRHTHQGRSASSRWARGQAWALYGYVQAADSLGDPQDLERAERIAAMWARSVRAGQLPRWDLDARSGPHDASAAAIAAAGAARLAQLRCGGGDRCAAGRPHRRLARRLLSPVLDRVERIAPLGRLAGQVYVRGGPRWDENAEFMFGIDFALEAAARLQGRSPPADAAAGVSPSP